MSGGEVDYAAVFFATPCASVVLSPELVIREVNPAYAELAGRTREDLLGRNILEMSPGSPEVPDGDGAANLRASLHRVRRTRRPDRMRTRASRVRLADGSGFEERHWTADNWPVLAEDGSLVAIVHRVEVATAGRGDPFGMYDALLVEVDQLGEALVSRADIDQAKGIVMAERRCTPEQAFDVLVRMSQDTNVKVRDVATAIVYRTGHPVSSTDGMPYSVAPGTRNGARSRSGTRSRSL